MKTPRRELLSHLLPWAGPHNVILHKNRVGNASALHYRLRCVPCVLTGRVSTYKSYADICSIVLYYPMAMEFLNNQVDLMHLQSSNREYFRQRPGIRVYQSFTGNRETLDGAFFITKLRITRESKCIYTRKPNEKTLPVRNSDHIYLRNAKL